MPKKFIPNSKTIEGLSNLISSNSKVFWKLHSITKDSGSSKLEFFIIINDNIYEITSQIVEAIKFRKSTDGKIVTKLPAENIIEKLSELLFKDAKNLVPYRI